MSTISVPSTLIRRKENGTTIVYKKHEELGRGGFAVVYRVTNYYTNEEFALKAIPKDRVSKPKTLEKLKSEIAIQKSLNHPNVVRSYDSFDDTLNYYIIIEFCPGKSVKNIVKAQGRLSESETSRILNDIMSGLKYLHDNRIIHRDLKLENFLVGQDGKIKIADFGLSTRLYFDDERKHTVCGTPNYLSPELVSATSKGHSYEVDIWAIGVSAFAMLTGKPPFEANKKNMTYEHIKNCQYQFPYDIRISPIAKDFIKSILQINPDLRPNAVCLSLHPFLQCDSNKYKPTTIVQNNNNEYKLNYKNSNKDNDKDTDKFTNKYGINKQYQVPTNVLNKNPVYSAKFIEKDGNNKLRNQNIPLSNNLYNVKFNANSNNNNLNSNLYQKNKNVEEIPIPRNFVVRFCDVSDKGCLSYLLLDGTTGAIFSDGSRLVMDPFETFIHYWENAHSTIPRILDPKGNNIGIDPKKISYLQLYTNTLKKSKSMFELPAKPYSRNSPLRHIKRWTTSPDAILFKLDDRNVQVNFEDHYKMFIFTASRKFFIVRSIKETGKPISFNDVKNIGPMKDEVRRFSIAKGMLSAVNQ
ncbi:Serine/threonine-protein kinase PLK1 [Tritrichomonas foetus]|uniref:Serine/threonine-protein kinase PLK1 n=1 Tax=Tritrichomonas foetus TaxID=1144522 RepID=A0A1J4JAE1_9EUKA|nr:Serine/threonine-protein kinase PLK1 [Tritrichomonas foetus]|eukprot:OHS96120.1 Serine/threonine-protein kinase PLK1 [Tritrichomonas foetus]